MTDRVRYRRLPGHAVALLRGRRLWLGPDHVLLVRSTYFAEQYRRFYFRDVQAIVITETGGALSYYFHASAVFVASLAIMTAYSGWAALAVICGIFAVVLFLIGIRLPNCACYLRTATTLERLPSLGRINAARKTLAILRNHIEAAQT